MSKTTISPTQRAEMFQLAYDWCLKSETDRGSPWVTATDLHRRLRAHAVEILGGLEYGSQGSDAYFIPVRLTGFDLGDVRDWLRTQVARGVLRVDYPSGRRTATGARFRPASADLTDAEKRTIRDREKAEERGPVIHLKGTDGRAACLPPKKPRLTYYSSRPKYVRTTEEAAKVTCVRCAKKATPVCSAPVAV